MHGNKFVICCGSNWNLMVWERINSLHIIFNAVKLLRFCTNEFKRIEEPLYMFVIITSILLQMETYNEKINYRLVKREQKNNESRLN